MTNNVLVLREIYRLLTGTMHDPTLFQDAPLPQKGYYFTPLGNDLRVEFRIGVPGMGDYEQSASMRIFRPGFGPGSWPGEMLAICEAADTNLADMNMALNLFQGAAGPDSPQSQLCMLIAERIKTVAIQARVNLRTDAHICVT